VNEDLKELLNSLQSQNVEFLVIGAHAVAFHGRARFTEDVDLWVKRSTENAERLRKALETFGAPISEEGAKRFAEEDRQMIRLGAPPNMVDILNFAGGPSFEEAKERSLAGKLEESTVLFPSLEDLREMKREANRPQDLADLDRLSDA
jgi:predicted nucleotidyltransferase